MSESWRVVLLTDGPPGIARFCQRFFEARGHRLAGIVTTSRRSRNYVETVSEVGDKTDVVIANDARQLFRYVPVLTPDLIISHIFPFRIPDDILALPSLGAVNIHPALLPKYRGTTTPFWLYYFGETTGGFTLHRMVTGFDAGPILAQVTFPLSREDTIDDFIGNAQASLPKLWELALPRIAVRDPGDPQDESQATYFSRPSESLRQLDWKHPANELRNAVHAWSLPFSDQPGAIGEIDGSSYRIFKARVADTPADSDSPGKVLRKADDSILIQTGDGILEILEWTPV